MSRLQEELKQNRPFDSLEAEALLSIVRTAAVLDHALNETLKPFGLTTTQYNVLRILRGAGETGLCGKEVAERLISPSPDIARLLDRMEETKLLARTRDRDDRRYVTATITPKGLQLLDDVEPALAELRRARVGSVDRDALQALIDTLDTIR
jgi:DNA-binding MarR family transcriptional regulator